MDQKRLKLTEEVFKTNTTTELLQLIRDYDNDGSHYESDNVNRLYCINRIAIICNIEDENDDNIFKTNLECLKKSFCYNW